MNRYVCVFVLSGMGFLFLPFALAETNNQCTAPSSYTSQFNSSSFYSKANQDFSCLVDYSTISPRLNQYQLIDIRLSPITAVPGAWVIPLGDLKHKKFLQNRNLLLVSDGFSRVDAAQKCAILRKKGFQNTKILLGGAQLLEEVTSKHKRPLSVNTIDAKSLLVEYFNGTVHIVSTSRNVSAKLGSMGFDDSNIHEIGNGISITDVVLNKAKSGFDPVVFVDDGDAKVDFNVSSRLPNVYVLDGGINSLTDELTMQNASEQARNRDRELPFCAQ